MAAVALQQIGVGLQGGKKVKPAVGAGGSLAPLAVQADQIGGAAEFLGQTGGDNAHHALVPALTGQDNGVGPAGALQHPHGLPVDLGLHLLALPVQLAQASGQIPGPAGIPGEKQLCGQFHPPHAPGGVDPRRQGIADGGGRHLMAVAAALIHERSDPRSGIPGQGL